MLVEAAPGDHLAGFDVDPAVAAAERHRLGLDRPFLVQYGDWLGRAVRLDLGESVKYRRPVAQLVAERAGKTALLGATALLLATVVGMPAGILTGSRRNLAHGARARALARPRLGSAARDVVRAAAPRRAHGMVSGRRVPAGRRRRRCWTTIRYLVAAGDRAGAADCGDARAPAVAGDARRARRAVGARGARARLLGPRASSGGTRFRLSLKPVLAIYGVIVGSVLSGSFAVEIVTSWPGLGALMYEGARRARPVSRRRLRRRGLDLPRARHPRCPTSRWRWPIRAWRSRRDGARANPPRAARASRSRRSLPRSRVAGPWLTRTQPRRAVRRLRLRAADAAAHHRCVGPRPAAVRLSAAAREPARAPLRRGSQPSDAASALPRRRAALGRCRARVALVSARHRRARPRPVRAARVGDAALARRRARRRARRAAHRRDRRRHRRASPAASSTMG